MDAQIIKTETGEELVVLPRSHYEALVARASGPSEADEDAGTARIIARSDAELAAGRELLLPSEVAEALMRGDNPLRVIRKWRDLTQTALSERTGVDQGYISAIECGGRAGSLDVFRKLATALAVPLDLLAGE